MDKINNKPTLFKSILKPLRLLLYAILFGSILLIFLILNTQMGLHFTLKAVEAFTQTSLVFQGATGTFMQGMHFRKIIYTQPQQTIQLENLSLKWKPLALLKWHLKIEKLHSHKILITRNKHETPEKIIKKAVQPTAFAPPKLPIYLIIKQLTVSEIVLKSPEARTTFQAKSLQGQIALTRTQLEGHLRIHVVSPFPVNGRLDLSGNTHHYQFLLGLSGKDFNWKIAGHGDETHLVFNTLQNELLKGTLTLNGWIKSPRPTVTTKPASVLSPQPSKPEASLKDENQLHWKFSLSASHIHLDKIFPAQLNGTLTGEGQDKAGKLILNLENSSYHNQPLEGQASLHVNYPKIKSFNAAFTSGKNTLFINGNINEEWAVQWTAQIDNIHLFYPSLEGSLMSQGEISGKYDSPKIHASLTIPKLKADSLFVKNVLAETTINMASLKDSSITLSAQEIKQNIFSIDNLTVTGNIKPTLRGFSIAFALKPGTFQYPVESRTITESFSGGKWETTIVPGKISSQLNVHLPGDSHFQGQMTLPNPIKLGSNQKIKGQLKGTMQNISFVSGLTSPTVRNITGQLSTDINIRGTLKKPNIESQLTLKAAAFLPVLNLHLQDIELKAEGKKQTITYEGHVKSKDTQLTLTGKSLFEPKTVVSDFHITGENFLITNTREIKIYASPNLNIHSKDGKTQITGTVEIPRASVKPRDFTNIITMPDDVHYIGETKPTNPFPVESDITVVMGNDVFLKYEGLSGYLTGEVKIKSEPSQPTTGIGQIKIKDGTYDIRGRKLTIHEGFFNYTGGLISNPGMQIKATRKIQVNNIGGIDPNLSFGVSDILVGLDVTGSVRRHQIRLFSEPSGLSQANIFAYLITGQSANAGAGAYFPLIMEAANSLGGGATSTFSEKIRKGFGFADISIQQNAIPSALPSAGTPTALSEQTRRGRRRELEKPTLVFGKALSPMLYINYAVTLANPLSGLQARYQLTKHWILQTSGVPGDKNASIDLIRVFESKH